MSNDLPFLAEYSKSSRALCKVCKAKIMKDELRLAAMVQSPMFDGKVPHWYHYRCFFGKFKVKSIGDVGHLDSLRWEDQTKIKEKIGGGSNGTEASPSATPSTKGGKKTAKRKATNKDSASNTDLEEFSVEFAKSSRSTCKYCDIKINKDVVRISKKDHESVEAKRFGPIPKWFHVDCFVTAREELEYFESADKLPGFGTLGIEEQKSLKQKLKFIERKMPPTDEVDGKSPAKKSKPDPKEDKKLKAQNVVLFGYIDKLKMIKKNELIELLEHNEQAVPIGESRIMDRLADIMTFGVLEPCPECKGQLEFSNSEYKCTGNITEWTGCLYKTTTPTRRPFKVPPEFKEQFDFLKKYTYKKRDRIIPKEKEEPSQPKALPTAATSRLRKPLDNASIVLLGKLNAAKEEIVQKIKDLGGKVTTKIGPMTTCVISTPEEVLKNSKRMKEAQQHGIHVVSEEFLTSVEKGGIAIMIVQHSIAKWGNKVEDRLANVLEKRSKFESSIGLKRSTMKLTVKGSSAVDPDSKLETHNHVLEKNGDPYNAVLGLVDISKGTNSYYKLQIIESDSCNSYWVFRSWGRVGTTIGGNKSEKMSSQMAAVSEFNRLYEDKTGNPWEGREKCDKQAGHFYPLEIDYGQQDEAVQKLKPGQNSGLHRAIQELICLLFDVESMKQAMVEFEIDLKKMPLGKLSKRQMEKAYSVLTEVQELLKSEGSETKFLDASNRFYTLIPHDFGMKVPPLLNTTEIIQSKVEMLESLMEIEVAYNLLKSANESDSKKDPIDVHYKQLKTEMSVLEKTCDEFQLLEKYVQNTHAVTHSSYALQVQEIFKVNREGESKKFKPFKKLHNRQLLWHGSRVTNFAGILSQGLRIAPPEAPVTGYMFGKGVYFADMVSKSANYCNTSRSNPTGILLLCEVALGNMYERTNAEMIQKLPVKMHSTKGIGSTHPNPAEHIQTPDGVTIPLGKPITDSFKKTSLLYNEYIVYDTAQINIKYLLKLNFDYKGGRR